MKNKYKIIIKGNNDGVMVKCTGNATSSLVMAGATQAIVGIARNFGYTVDDIIGALKENKSGNKKGTKKNVESSNNSRKTN